LVTKSITTKICYIFFYNYFNYFVNFNFCIIKNYE
jgi:hypothetical protein